METEYTPVPLALLDGSVINTPISNRTGFIFNAPLDLNKLRDSWHQALRARPIMQASVHRSQTAASGLEYHVLTPTGMDKYLEAQRHVPDAEKDFLCLDESHRSVSEFSTGLKPAESAQDILIADQAPNEARYTSLNAVKDFDAALESGRPLCTIQVTRFCDATVVVVSCSHVLGDVHTVKTLLKSWESALHGIPPEPWARLGEDPFARYGPGGDLAGEDVTSRNPPLPPGWRFYDFFDKLLLMYHTLWDYYITRPEKTICQKYIFIPEATVQSLVEQARSEITNINIKQEPPRITRSNVLHAWLLQRLHGHLHPDTSATTLTVISKRHRPPTGLAPQDKGTDFPTHNWYNATMAAVLPALKVRDLRTMSLGEVALHLHNGIREASTPENMRRLITYSLHHTHWQRPTNRLLMFGPPDHRWSGISDWRVVRMGELDFTPARDAYAKENDKVTVQGFTCNMLAGFSMRDRWWCMGEAGGGVWLSGLAGERQWNDPDGFGKYLAKL